MPSYVRVIAGAHYVVCVKREVKVLDRASVMFARAFYHSLLTSHRFVVLCVLALPNACVLPVALYGCVTAATSASPTPHAPAIGLDSCVLILNTKHSALLRGADS
jgi:hypothetical protein